MVTLGWFTVPGATEGATKLGYCFITAAGRKVMCHAGILILEATMEVHFPVLVRSDVFMYIFLKSQQFAADSFMPSPLQLRNGLKTP